MTTAKAARARAKTPPAARLERKITAITIAMLHFDQELTTRLARRPGGIDVVSDGKTVFRLVVPGSPLSL